MIDSALEMLGVENDVRASEDVRLEALQFAIERGGRSGRVATQFAKLVAARCAMKS